MTESRRSFPAVKPPLYSLQVVLCTAKSRKIRELLMAGSRSIFTLLVVLAIGEVSANEYFKIQAIDSQTGRGVPLVELLLQNGTMLVTDSNGIVAFNQPELMNQDVSFSFRSYGYGDVGQTLHPSAGGSAQVGLDRINR